MAGQLLEKLLIGVLNMSLTASVIILAVFLIRIFLRRAPRVFSYALWLVVLFRLLCPVSFTADVSLLGALKNEAASQGKMEYIPENIGYQAEPEISLPVPAAEDVVNRSLPAANPQGSVNPMQVILYLGARIWVLGICGFLIYSVVSLVRLRKRLKTAVWEKENIYRMEGGTPFVYGVLRPRIYLPAGLLEEEEGYILLHERIHIRRGDHVFRLLAYLALCLHWFNPLVWAAFAFSGRDMEMSCDEAVIRRLGRGVKKEYSASLLSLACGRRVVKGLPIAFGEGDTRSRVKNVLRYKKPRKILIAAAALVCAALAVVLLANPGRKSEEKSVYSGVVTMADMGESYQPVVRIPGLGDIDIPEAEKIEYLIESESVNSNGLLYQGDLVRIIFPAGEEVGILETWPGRFSVPAETIEVYGEGFALEQTASGRWRVTVPIGMARDAKTGDTLEIYHHAPEIDGQETELLASTAVLSVDEENYHIWVELSAEEAKVFLSEFGSGVKCDLLPSEADTVQTGGEEATEEVQELTPDLLTDGQFSDGTYRIYIQSLSGSAYGIDRYVVSFWDEETDGELPFLAFVDDSVFLVNEEMASVRYETVTFDTFAGIVEGGAGYLNVPCTITIQDGMITKAVLDSSWYPYGISYQSFYRDTWYTDIQDFPEMEGIDPLEAYYTLDRTEEADFAESRGLETAEIYTGNIGDGDSGIVLFKNADGEILYSASAHSSRAGWNNIYLGEADGEAFLMTAHIEDRGTYGEYSYQVFRLGAYGQILQSAGSSFTFDDGRILYDDDIFREWADGMSYYLERSHLLLSSQEGELRTEGVSEADKYSYETLKREG